MRSHKTTKEQLLLLIKKQADITFEEIEGFFSISEPAIRKHLSEMEKQGLIIKEKQKQKIGRPYFTYQLTSRGHGRFPNQYESLPVEMLRDLEELQGEEAVKALLDKRTSREIEKLTAGLMGASNFEEKVERLVELQNNTGYMVDVEKTTEGDFVLTNFNCPIANIAFNYRQVCTDEKAIYTNLFKDSEVFSQALITDGEHKCKWLIKEPKNPAK